MTIPSDAAMAEFIEYRLELARVCPEAADGLVFPGSQPPALSHRHRIEILRTLPDGAGIDAFLAAWLAFVAANPAAVPTPGATYEPDFYRSHGHGRFLAPPPTPIPCANYFRALRLGGEPEGQAGKAADDFADEVVRRAFSG